MERKFSDIHCTQCGAPAKYNIIKHKYLCEYCDGKVEVGEAVAQKQGFRSLQQDKIQQGAKAYHLMSASCSGCGSTIVFEEGEAVQNCAFCGRSLVRKDYMSSQEMPELVVPFRITQKEALGCLEDWCRLNSSKREAKSLKAHMDALTGCYLPYELIRGPVSSRVGRMDSSRTYECRGFVDNVFVNCSNQLDNLLLDGMEPYELEELMEFDFSYVAGQRVKVKDIDSKELQKRVENEVSVSYSPVVEKTLETKAIDVKTDSEFVVRMPVLLPVYYISAGDTVAAVNGQTGKVSVRAEKKSYHYFLPWWLKAILSTILICGISFGAFRLFGWETWDSLYFSGILALFFMIVTLALFSDTVQNSFRVEAIPKIFTSKTGSKERVGKELVDSSNSMEKATTPPVFFETLGGVLQPVKLRFTSPLRTAKTIFLSTFVMFLPVIVALFLNGFDFARLELGGSAVWFCIAIPTIPIYILKFARVELYEHPWIYIISENGTEKRYKEKSGIKVDKDLIKTILKALIVPPISLGVWFGIASFAAMCYLTAFGFD